MRGEDVERGRAALAAGGPPPACAGKTSPICLRWDALWDHPRVRGEDSVSTATPSVGWGPPPRARGRHQGRGDQGHRGGTTPACAGKTGGRVRWLTPALDHPRVRGEDTAARPTAGMTSGPPPRARVRHVRMDFEGRIERTTPACAGKTVGRQLGHCGLRDHPRVRGEDVRVGSRPKSSYGPPPRARGRHTVYTFSVYARRTTPACAGKTPLCACPNQRNRDHPRVRGEDNSEPSVTFDRVGTTPACGGKTL